MNKEEAVEVVLEILTHEFQIPETVAYLNTNTSLFLAPFNLDAISMAYLIILLQERFHVESYSGYTSGFQNTTIENFAKWISDNN